MHASATKIHRGIYLINAPKCIMLAIIFDPFLISELNNNKTIKKAIIHRSVLLIQFLIECTLNEGLYINQTANGKISPMEINVNAIDVGT